MPVPGSHVRSVPPASLLALFSGGIALLVAALAGCVSFDDLARTEEETPTAARCGDCHRAVYEEWRASPHASAFVSAASGFIYPKQTVPPRHLRQVEFAIVFFEKEVTSYPGGRRAARATPAAKAEAAEKVRAVQPGDWTCLLDGLITTIEAANRSTVQRKAVIVMSDGKPAVPGDGLRTYRERILTEARAANRQRIPIHVVGVGRDGPGSRHTPSPPHRRGHRRASDREVELAGAGPGHRLPLAEALGVEDVQAATERAIASRSRRIPTCSRRSTPRSSSTPTRSRASSSRRDRSSSRG